MSLVSLSMSLAITLKREQFRYQWDTVEQLLANGNYETVVKVEEEILIEEEALKQLYEAARQLKEEKQQTLKHLSFLKPEMTQTLQIQSYTLNEKERKLEIVGHTTSRPSLLNYVERLRGESSFVSLDFDSVKDDQGEGLIFTVWIEME